MTYIPIISLTLFSKLFLKKFRRFFPNFLIYLSMIYNGKTLDESGFQELCSYWQNALRLNDWDIEFTRVFSVSEFNNTAEVWGECEVDGSMMEAHVRILNIDKVDKDFGMEHTIVHELLHITLNDLDICDCDYEIEERIINTIAKCLIKLKGGS